MCSRANFLIFFCLCFAVSFNSLKTKSGRRRQGKSGYSRPQKHVAALCPASTYRSRRSRSARQELKKKSKMSTREKLQIEVNKTAAFGIAYERPKVIVMAVVHTYKIIGCLRSSPSHKLQADESNGAHGEVICLSRMRNKDSTRMSMSFTTPSALPFFFWQHHCGLCNWVDLCMWAVGHTINKRKTGAMGGVRKLRDKDVPWRAKGNLGFRNFVTRVLFFIF